MTSVCNVVTTNKLTLTTSVKSEPYSNCGVGYTREVYNYTGITISVQDRSGYITPLAPENTQVRNRVVLIVSRFTMQNSSLDWHKSRAKEILDNPKSNINGILIARAIATGDIKDVNGSFGRLCYVEYTHTIQERYLKTGDAYYLHELDLLISGCSCHDMPPHPFSPIGQLNNSHLILQDDLGFSVTGVSYLLNRGNDDIPEELYGVYGDTIFKLPAVQLDPQFESGLWIIKYVDGKPEVSLIPIKEVLAKSKSIPIAFYLTKTEAEASTESRKAESVSARIKSLEHELQLKKVELQDKLTTTELEQAEVDWVRKQEEYDRKQALEDKKEHYEDRSYQRREVGDSLKTSVVLFTVLLGVMKWLS